MRHTCQISTKGYRELCEADIRALVTAIRDRVENVSLYDIPLDMEELTKYEGQGRCKWLAG